MDKVKKTDWSWLKNAMPGVAKMMEEKRIEHGGRHLNECWRRSVEMGEPGWLFLREGALAIGTPFKDDDPFKAWQGHAIKSNQAMVLIRAPEKSNGTN